MATKKKATKKKANTRKATTKKTTNKKVTKKKKLGRPTDYRPEYCDLLIEHMSEGLSYETFGATIGVSRQTVYDWEKAQPPFLDAKKIAVDQCRLFWEKKGVGLIDSKEGNAGVWIYNMKCRFPKVWRPKKEVDVSARYQNDVEAIKNMSTAQLAELAETAARYLKEKENDES